MGLNKNELILDKVRSLTAHELSTDGVGGKMLFRLTSLEEPTLSCTAEGEEVVDAVGSLITTLYRAKKATFSANNSLISLDLAAAQYGTKKEMGEVTDYAYDVIKVDGATSVKLSHKAIDGSIIYIYGVEGGQIGTTYKYELTENAGETTFTVSEGKNEEGKDVTVINLPTKFAESKVYVEYTYKNENAMRVVNKASSFPSACSVVIYAYFKDVCDENIVYSGKIICPKAKLNPEQVELALTSTGKHAFEFTMMRDYCSEEGEDELFSIIVSE